MLVLNLGLRRAFLWRFVIANVSRLIIGTDFLSYYKLLIYKILASLMNDKFDRARAVHPVSRRQN